MMNEWCNGLNKQMRFANINVQALEADHGIDFKQFTAQVVFESFLFTSDNISTDPFEVNFELKAIFFDEINQSDYFRTTEFKLFNPSTATSITMPLFMHGITEKSWDNISFNVKDRIMELIKNINYDTNINEDMIHNITYHNAKRVVVIRIKKDLNDSKKIIKSIIKVPIMFPEIKSKKSLTTTAEYLKELDAIIDNNRQTFFRTNLNSLDKIKTFLQFAGLLNQITEINMIYNTFEALAKHNNVTNQKAESIKAIVS